MWKHKYHSSDSSDLDDFQNFVFNRVISNPNLFKKVVELAMASNSNYSDYNISIDEDEYEDEDVEDVENVSNDIDAHFRKEEAKGIAYKKPLTSVASASSAYDKEWGFRTRKNVSLLINRTYHPIEPNRGIDSRLKKMIRTGDFSSYSSVVNSLQGRKKDLIPTEKGKRGFILPSSAYVR